MMAPVEETAIVTGGDLADALQKVNAPRNSLIVRVDIGGRKFAGRIAHISPVEGSALTTVDIDVSSFSSVPDL